MAFGSMSPAGLFPSMANPGAPADNSPGQMGMQILRTALAQRGKAGQPPSMPPQIFGQNSGAAPADPAAAGSGGASGGPPGMLQGLLAKMGLGGSGAANPFSGGMTGLGDAFKRNAMLPMRDPNAPMTGDAPPGMAAPAVGGVPAGSPPAAAGIPLPPVRPPAIAQAAPQVPPMLDAGTPIIPTALTGIGLA